MTGVQTELASRSYLSESTIRSFEKGRKMPTRNNLAAVQRALEEAGIEFIGATGVNLAVIGDGTTEARTRRTGALAQL